MRLLGSRRGICWVMSDKIMCLSKHRAGRRSHKVGLNEYGGMRCVPVLPSWESASRSACPYQPPPLRGRTQFWHGGKWIESNGGVAVSGGSTERRLAAILAADVVGFSRQMGADETGTLARLAALRAEIFDPLLAEHRGRLFKVMGDGFLAEFASAVQAVACAIAIQARLAERVEGGEKLQLRIGLHSRAAVPCSSLPGIPASAIAAVPWT